LGLPKIKFDGWLNSDERYSNRYRANHDKVQYSDTHRHTHTPVVVGVLHRSRGGSKLPTTRLKQGCSVTFWEQGFVKF